MKSFYFVLLTWGVCLAVLLPGSVQADTLSPVSTITTTGNIELLDLTYNGTTYVVANGDLILGITTRWYVIDNVEYHWPDGDPVPAGCPTVGGTSDPKVGDIGAKADNFLLADGGATDISSIDGIDFQETIFPYLVNTIFVLERGGNDNGIVYPILADDSLGTAQTLTGGGAMYGNTGVGVNGQNAFGYVLETDVPVKGIRITASGHDSFVVTAKSVQGKAVLIAPEIDDSINTPYDFEWKSGWGGGAKQVIKYLMYLDPNEIAVSDTEDRKLPGGTRWVEDQLVLAPVLDPNGPVLYNLTETLLYDTPYFWAVDTYVGEPNVGGVGFINIECIPGDTWRFWGPFSVPDLTGPEDVIILPDPLTHEFPANPQASFTVNISSAFDVYDAVWYKESDPGNAILSAGRFSIVTTDTESTLTISDVVTTDNDTYYCVVRLDIDGNPGTPEESDHAILSLRSILRHRYSFDEDMGDATKVTDSVGGKHGTIVDPGSSTEITWDTGELIYAEAGDPTQNGSADPNAHFVDLPNGMISDLAYNYATFMVWFTWDDVAQPNWVRLFDFGISNQGEGISGSASNTNFIELTPQASSGNIRFENKLGPTINLDSSEGAAPVGQEVMVTVVLDKDADTMTMYLGDQQVGQASLPDGQFKDLNDLNNWLGRSQYSNPLYIGKYNELRIYDIPLTSPWIEAMAKVGPDVIEVNPCINPNPQFDTIQEGESFCIVDLLDLRDFLSDWLDCGRLDCP